jgi:PAS domain S-box-containing protein
MALDPAFFATDFEKTQIGPHSAMALIGLDGITRVRRNNEKVSYGEDISKSQLFKELPKAANGHYVAAAASDGQVRSVSYRSVTDLPLVIIVASSVNDILEKLRPREQLYFATAATGTLLVLTLAGMAVLTLRTRIQRISTLEESSDRLRAIIDASPVSMALNDQAGNVLYLNPAFISTFGYAQTDIPDLSQWWGKAYPDPAYRQWVIQTWGAELERMASTQTAFAPMEVNIRCKDGKLKTVQAAAASYVSSKEKTHLVVLFDTTDLFAARQALQEALNAKTGLLNEVHHRVKNNLQVISSLLRLETGRTQGEETRNVLTDMQGRIRSMALLHESLYRSGIFAQIELGNYLKRLSTESFRSQSRMDGTVQLATDLSPCNVSLDQATPCALLVNELLSNCLKHAFPDGRQGTVHISLKPAENGNNDPARWCLCVSDDGIGLPSDFDERKSQSLGMQLVGDLVTQIGGTLHTGPGPGATFTIVFTPDLTNVAGAPSP